VLAVIVVVDVPPTKVDVTVLFEKSERNHGALV
jgi:hypothetical protein